MISRRSLLIAGLSAFAAPLSGVAQQAERVWRIGYLSVSRPDTDGRWLAAFERGLRDLGYVEGRNVVLERRHSGGHREKLDELAAELVRLKLDVIVTYGGIAAVKKASDTVPIVMTVHADPVRAGVVSSLARPGGQVTGLSDFHGGLAPKRLERLKEVVPTLSRVAVLWNPVGTVPGPGQLQDIEAAAPGLGVTILPMEVRGPDDIDRAFATMKRERVGGLMVVSEPTVVGGLHRRRIVDLAIKGRLPAIGTVRQWVEDGFLMSYGTNFDELWRRAATYVDKILKGARPGEIPVEQPTKLEPLINLRTARALGLTISPSLRARADEIIE